MKQLYFIEGRLLGESPRKAIFVHSTLQEPTSDLYFCGRCGKVYATLPVIRADGSSTPWQSYRHICRQCGVSHQRFLGDWPGSIWRSWDHDFLATLPVSVLQWELERHLDAYERIPNGYK